MSNLLWTKTVELDTQRKKVLAIDASLTGTGWCVATSEKDVTFGDLKNDLRNEERLQWIINKLKDFLELHTPNVLVLEDYSFGSSTSAYDLGELGGLIRVLFKEYQDCNPTAQIVKYAPTELKKFVTGKGNAPKEIMLMKILQKFGVETANNNQADAVGLCFMALLEHKPTKKKK